MNIHRWYAALLIGAAGCGSASTGVDESPSSQEQAFTSGGKFFCDSTGLGKCTHRNPRFFYSGTRWQNNGDLQRISQTSNFSAAEIDNQHFSFEEVTAGTGRYQIHVSADPTHDTNDCIAPSSGVNPTPRGELRALSCTNSSNFLWTFTAEPKGSFQLKNVSSGECIHSDDITFEDHVPIHTAPCAAPNTVGIKNQLLFLDDFDPPPSCPYVGNGLAGNSGQSYQALVRYHNGILRPNHVVYLEYWGTYGVNPSKAAERTAFNNNVSTLLGSSAYWSRFAEYVSTNGKLQQITANQTTLSGNMALNDSTIRQNLINEFNKSPGGLPLDPDGIYVIQLGPENQTARFGGPGLGYHDVFTVNGVVVPYAIINYSNPLPIGTLDHEIMEATTDPVPKAGWFDAQFNGEGEIGDLCNGQGNTILGIPVQKFWSQSACACL